LIYSTLQGDARWFFTGSDGRPHPTVVRGPLRSNNLSALLAAARAGMGIAALPRYVAHASIKSGAVRTVLEDWTLPTQEVHAVYPSPRLVPNKVRNFITWLQTHLGEAWWTRTS
jgi:DNA-binding transcriptional LysR family regulator